VIKLVAQEMEAQFAQAPKVGHAASLNPNTIVAPAPEAGDPSFSWRRRVLQRREHGVSGSIL
jgi:hypothetical protein